MIFGDLTCWVSQNGKFAPYFYDFLDFLYNMWYTLCVDKILTRFSALVGLKYEQSETKTNNAVSVEKNYRRTTTKVVFAIILSTEKQLAGTNKKSELAMRLKLEDCKAEEETPRQAKMRDLRPQKEHKTRFCQLLCKGVVLLYFALMCEIKENLILTRFSATVGLKYEQSETKTNNAVSVEKNYRRTTTKVSQK